MKLFFISLLYAINLPSLSLGLKCLTCSENGSGVGHCTENQKPVLKECQVESPSVPHCYLEEYLENRKPFAMGCYGVLVASTNCHTSTRSTPQGGLINLLICTCGTDSCNDYENGIQCHSCVGNIGQGGRHGLTDYKCKEGETPFIEKKCPVNALGCLIRWDSKNNEYYTTKLGCRSGVDSPDWDIIPEGQTFDCSGNPERGHCQCNTNLCNTVALKERYVKIFCEEERCGYNGVGSSLSGIAIVYIIVIFIVIAIIFV